MKITPEMIAAQSRMEEPKPYWWGRPLPSQDEIIESLNLYSDRWARPRGDSESAMAAAMYDARREIERLRDRLYRYEPGSLDEYGPVIHATVKAA